MPRYVDVDQRRTDVVNAAWKVIADEGLEALTIRRLASEVGGATGRITNYFSSKDEILIAVLEELTDSHTSGLTSLQEELEVAGTDVDLVARAIVHGLPIDEPRRQDWKVWLAFWSRAAMSPSVAAQHRETYRQWRGALGIALKTLANTSIPAKDLDRASEHLLACIDGLGIHLLIEPDRIDEAGLIEIIKEHISRACSGFASA
jgi:AcrR family transcriptional regulator